MKIIRVKNYKEMSKEAAKLYVEEINKKPDMILGLATGSTPLGLYSELIDNCKEGVVSFKDIRSFNLDEYYPIEPTNDQSYRYFMNENLFSKVDIDISKTDVPNGKTDNAEVECVSYDKKIEEAGGIDIQLLGVGINGHIGFNEPEDSLYVGTHRTGLDESTIKANARFFESEEAVPKEALTMGMGNIMKAKKVVLLISGKAKQDAFKKLTSGRITTECPVTILALHNDCVVFVDEEAAGE